MLYEVITDMIALYIQAAIYAVFTLVYFYLHVYADETTQKENPTK